MTTMARTYGRLGKEYDLLLQDVVYGGDAVAPRGMKIKEVRPLVVTLLDPSYCIVKRSGFSHAFMYMEIAQLLAGVFKKDLLEVCSKNAASMLNSYGAYGPRIVDQIPYLVAELQRDSDSRRAQLLIARPDDLRLASDLDMPCTTTLQCFIRDGKLELVVTMRSWDLVWGLSYDVPCFVSVQNAIAGALDVPIGTYTHVAGSGHVYARHFDLIAEGTNEQLRDLSAGPYGWTRAEAAMALNDFTNAMKTGTLAGLPPRWKDAEPYWQSAINKHLGA